MASDEDIFGLKLAIGLLILEIILRIIPQKASLLPIDLLLLAVIIILIEDKIQEGRRIEKLINWISRKLS